jgi:hypothetical protein
MNAQPVNVTEHGRRGRVGVEILLAVGTLAFSVAVHAADTGRSVDRGQYSNRPLLPELQPC